MSLIKNLVKEPEKKHKDNDANGSDNEEKTLLRPIIKSATDLQRLRIEKLMKNPDKPVQIPDFHSRETKRNREPEPPSFVRNVMGSSAGAGSGEFHVYRHLRRKEYARQKGIQTKSLTEHLNHEYQQKLEENKRIAEEKTAKKRAKRLKKKKRAKVVKKTNSNAQESHNDEHSDATESSDDEKAVESTMQQEVVETDNNDADKGAPIERTTYDKINEMDNKEADKSLSKALDEHEGDKSEAAKDEITLTTENTSVNALNSEHENSNDKELQEDANKNN